jgi:uncharacterized DUF497 family protein
MKKSMETRKMKIVWNKPKSKSQKRNQFEVSFGNIHVLSLIPQMMLEEKWRNKIRKLVMDFEFGDCREHEKN